MNSANILKEDQNFRNIGVSVDLFPPNYTDKDEIFRFKIAALRYSSKELHDTFKVDRMIMKVMQVLKKLLDPVSFSMIKFREKGDEKIVTVPGFFQLYGFDIRQNNVNFKKINYDSVDINRKNDLEIYFESLSKHSMTISIVMSENSYVKNETYRIDHPSFYLAESINNKKRYIKLLEFVNSVYEMLRKEAKETAKYVGIVGMKTRQDFPEARDLIQNFAHGFTEKDNEIHYSPMATALNTSRSRKLYKIKEAKKSLRRSRPPINALLQIKKDYSGPKKRS